MALTDKLRDAIVATTETELRVGIFRSPAALWILYLRVRRRMQRGRWPCERTHDVIECLDKQDFWNVVKWMHRDGRIRLLPGVVVEYAPEDQRSAREAAA